MKAVSIKILILCVITVCFLGFSGCDVLDSTSGGGGNYLSWSNIEFYFAEGYQGPSPPCEPDIVLYMQTEDTYNCLYSSLECSVEVVGNEVSIQILGVFCSDHHSSNSTPAYFRSFLDIPNGEYSLTFWYEKKENIHNPYVIGEDEYLLTISDSAISISEVEKEFTESKFDLYWRIPQKSFYYSCWAGSEISWVCDDFADTLLANIQLEEFTFPDSGVAYYPRRCPTYLYQDEWDFYFAGALFKWYFGNIKSQYPDQSLNCRMQNWLGDYYNVSN